MAAKLLDISGQRFGRLVALEFLGKPHAFKWSCKCDCGQIHATTGFKLRSGAVKSCGCLDQERLLERNTTHGLSHTKEYHIYLGMLRRCAGDGEHAHYYTERGITVCDVWTSGDGHLSGFECFLLDMGPRPSDRHSIDRIDNDGNYEPGNCQWALPLAQSRNRRGRRMVTYDGRQMCLSEAAEAAGVPYKIVLGRLKCGWALDAALAKKTIGRWA